jgi:hypothetical protein
MGIADGHSEVVVVADDGCGGASLVIHEDDAGIPAFEDREDQRAVASLRREEVREARVQDG